MLQSLITLVMIAILADDLSGAAELAGIAAARGFKAEVQTVFDPLTDADLIAVDGDTRTRLEAEAVGVVREITRQILAARPSWIYKKTDSVLRGHIRAEIEAMLEVTGRTNCLFIPANPSKGRVVREGRYFVADVPLDETVFANDPDHPRRSSLVRELLGESDRIQTPDAITLRDLELPLPATTLAAGAADFFSAQLEKRSLGFSPIPLPAFGPRPQPRSLLLCGSLAAWDTGRDEQMRKRGYVVKTIADEVFPTSWEAVSRLMLAIGPQETEDTTTLTGRLVDKALPLLSEPGNLRIGLEGGATATAFIRRMGWTRFEVIPEGHTGVGILRPPGGPILCVKPGSYDWPEASL